MFAYFLVFIALFHNMLSSAIFSLSFKFVYFLNELHTRYRCQTNVFDTIDTKCRKKFSHLPLSRQLLLALKPLAEYLARTCLTIQSLSLFEASHCPRPLTIRSLSLFKASHYSKSLTIESLSLFKASHCPRPLIVQDLSLFKAKIYFAN